MDEKYYLIKNNEYPKSMGLTIRVKGKTIENLTGDDSKLKKYGCSVNNRGVFFTSQNCLVFELTQREAEDNKKNYDSWKMLQAYVATDAIKESSFTGMSAFY